MQDHEKGVWSEHRWMGKKTSWGSSQAHANEGLCVGRAYRFMWLKIQVWYELCLDSEHVDRMDRFAWVWCLMHQSEVDVCPAKGDRGLHRIDEKKSLQFLSSHALMVGYVFVRFEYVPCQESQRRQLHIRTRSTFSRLS